MTYFFHTLTMLRSTQFHREIRPNTFAGIRTMLLACVFVLTLFITGSSAEPISAQWKPVAEGFVSPTSLVAPEDGTNRLFVTDQVGKIYVIDGKGNRLEEPLLDLSDELAIRTGFDERGLLSMALHPKFSTNGRFYVYYSAPTRPGAPEDMWGTEPDHTSRISEFRISEENRNKANPDSERVLLEVDQPHFNHNGGRLAFGPDDGYLYIGLGDGGSANDAGEGHAPGGNAQDITSLLGSILRIDVNPGANRQYTIPEDNPFVGRPGRDEIYAYGIRNPWSLTFDQTGNRTHLYVGDIGQNLYESVLIVGKGGNYGWNYREGFHCFDPDNPNDPPADCPRFGPHGEPLLDPIIEYKNRKIFSEDSTAYGTSVTGGYVYRGDEVPELRGEYIFGDWSRTKEDSKPKGIVLRGHRPEQDLLSRWEIEPLATENHPDGIRAENITAFGTDQNHELYLLTQKKTRPVNKDGRVYKLVSDK